MPWTVPRSTPLRFRAAGGLSSAPSVSNHVPGGIVHRSCPLITRARTKANFRPSCVHVRMSLRGISGGGGSHGSKVSRSNHCGALRTAHHAPPVRFHWKTAVAPPRRSSGVEATKSGLKGCVLRKQAPPEAHRASRGRWSLLVAMPSWRPAGAQGRPLAGESALGAEVVGAPRTPSRSSRVTSPCCRKVRRVEDVCDVARLNRAASAVTVAGPSSSSSRILR